MSEEKENCEFEIGEEVYIKNDLITLSSYGDVIFMKDMEIFRGQKAKIKKIQKFVHSTEKFFMIDLDEEAHAWSKEMFEVNKNSKVKGVSKNEPIVTNDQGGKQSKSLYRLDLVPPLALLKVGEELSKGLEHYPPDNWKLISIEDHLNHALIHLYAWIAGDKSDDHLSHATCRLLFATDLEEKNK